MTTLYVPADCHPLCKLRPYVIGDDKAGAIAALYKGPGSNLTSYRKKAQVILGAPIAHSSFLRHIDHLREGPQGWGDPADPWEGPYDALLAELKELVATDTAQYWDLVIAAIETAGADGPWQDSYVEAMDDLGRIDNASAEAHRAA